MGASQPTGTRPSSAGPPPRSRHPLFRRRFADPRWMELVLMNYLPIQSPPTSTARKYAIFTSQFHRLPLTQVRRNLHLACSSIAMQKPLDDALLRSDIERACLTNNVEAALSAILDLEKQGIAPDPNWFTSLLHSCADSRSLFLLRKVYNHLKESPFATPAVILNALVVLFCKLGSKRDAGRVVEELCNLAYTRGRRAYRHDRTVDPKRKEAYMKVFGLHKQLREAGYIPDTRFVLHDIDEEAKERALMYHSERIAIAYGLINTPPGTTLRIMKNLRICGDCHSAIKIMSRVVEREIIVRDNKRFHHFRDGLCSCGDYW